MVSMRHPLRSRRRTRIAALFTACAVLAASAAAAHAAPFEASVDRQVVDAGDPVRLTLRFSGDAPIERPDLAPLGADFEIVGSQQSQRMSVVNGAVEQALEVELLLQPKRSGTLEIPALHAGDLASEPLEVTVRDAGASAPAAPDADGATSPDAAATTTPDVVARAARAGQAPPDLFIAADVDQASPFVQGEVRYTVRVYDGIGIREGALTTPEASGARIEPRGDTRTREQVVGGRRYVVHERAFAILPQSAGELTIPPVVLQARVPDEGGHARRSPFGDGFGDDVFAEMFAQMRAGGFGGSLVDRMMNPGREVRVRSNPVTLTVQGRPGEAGTGWFLPANAVTLTQAWSPAKPTFRVGETVQRTITLTAEGASAAQLPALVPGDVGGVKQYAGKPETRSIARAGGPAAELTQTFDLLPTSSGTITLPRVEVAWWDVASGTQRTAVLPEESVEVLPAAGTTSPAAPQPAPQAQVQAHAQASSPGTSAVAADGTSGTATAPTDETRDHDAAWNAGSLLATHPLAGGAGALVLAALGGTTLWLVRRRRLSTHTTAAQAAARTAPRVPARALVDALHRACTSGDARAVRDALLAWARATWSDAPPPNAAAVARRLADPSFARAVKSLDDSLYAPHATSLDGDAFWRAFQQARRAGSPVASDDAEVLPALYPDSRMA